MDGKDFEEEWSYSSVIGMLYLTLNSQPEITYAMHQCTHVTHNPKASHGNAEKRICQYLKGTKSKK